MCRFLGEGFKDLFSFFFRGKFGYGNNYYSSGEAQQKALQLLLDGFKVPYESEPPSDATEYLTSTKANKEKLDAAIEEAKRGGGVEIKLDDLWK